MAASNKQWRIGKKSKDKNRSLPRKEKGGRLHWYDIGEVRSVKLQKNYPESDHKVTNHPYKKDQNFCTGDEKHPNRCEEGFDIESPFSTVLFQFFFNSLIYIQEFNERRNL